MLDRDYYILLSMLETIAKILRYSQHYQSAEELYQNDRDFDATMMNFIVLGKTSENYPIRSRKKTNRLTGKRFMDFET